MTEREVSRPSGWPPPAEASIGGAKLKLAPLAEEVARRHLERHPDDVERYGELAQEWAVHDMQHVLAWAFGESSGFVDLQVWQSDRDRGEILMVSRWRDRDAFKAYMRSAEHRVSHDRIPSALKDVIRLERLEHLHTYEVVAE